MSIGVPTQRALQRREIAPGRANSRGRIGTTPIERWHANLRLPIRRHADGWKETANPACKISHRKRILSTDAPRMHADEMGEVRTILADGREEKRTDAGPPTSPLCIPLPAALSPRVSAYGFTCVTCAVLAHVFRCHFHVPGLLLRAMVRCHHSLKKCRLRIIESLPQMYGRFQFHWSVRCRRPGHLPETPMAGVVGG